MLAKPGYCDQHRKQVYIAQKQVVNDDYKERNRFYQRKAWKLARQERLTIEPLCRHCKSNGKIVEATHVDHIVPITSGGAELEQWNLQSLCKSCHERKTRIEQAGGE